jgi:hypothetical protein
VPTAEPPPPPLNDADLQRYVTDCARQIDSWRPGQVRFAATLTIPLNQSAEYQATVDIRSGAQEQPAPSPGTLAENVVVRCGLGARLVPVGSGVSIGNQDEWILRDFDTPGVVEWDWTIRATDADDTQVRLEIRPAVAVVYGGYVVPANEDSHAPTVSYLTDIHVGAPLVDSAESWFTRTGARFSLSAAS